MKRLSLLSALLPALFAPGVFISHLAEASAGGSDIEKELVAAADFSTRRGESRQEYLARLIAEVKELPDKDWDGLSKPAQDWFNDCADVLNVNKKDPKPDFAFPDFPDLPKQEETSTRRRRSTDDEPEFKAASAANLAVGQRVKLTSKRGKVYEGNVIELDKKLVVVKAADGGEDEIPLENLDKVEIFHGTAGAAEEPEDPIKVGATVTIVTKRGKEVTGKLVELSESIIVLEVDGKEEEYMPDRVETIKPAGGKSAEAPASSGRRATSDDKGAAAGTKTEPDAKPPRSKNEGVSIGQRIKELMAEDLEHNEETLTKALTKEKMEFRPATVKLNFAENKKFLDALLKAGRIKK